MEPDLDPPSIEPWGPPIPRWGPPATPFEPPRPAASTGGLRPRAPLLIAEEIEDDFRTLMRELELERISWPHARRLLLEMKRRLGLA